MKILVTFCRWFVGILFIFSGMIKLNDPLGFSYKLDEYFSAAVLGLEFLQPFALPLAIFLVIFEVILGVMLLIGFQKKFTIWSLLLMILFFTFLTFYSAYFNKVTDCGCFGDAIPLTPWQSFTKDVILLVMIVILFIKKDLWHSAFAKATSSIIIVLTTVLCLLLGYHVLMHLPVLDFRAYKVGTDIETAMQKDPNDKDVYEFDWYYTVNGEEVVVTTDGLPPEGYGKQDKVETRTIYEAQLPVIHDFSITRNGEDFTQEFLDKEKVALILIYDTERAEAEGMLKIPSLVSKTQAAGFETVVLSANGAEDVKELLKSYEIDLEFYTTDGTQLKTAVRSTPSVMLLEKGVIIGKAHWNDFEQLSL
ncbi:MAG: BT_3928 family protein [Nonlabens sp.]